MTDGLVAIASDGLSAAIAPLGAELQWLRDGRGCDLLWHGDPAWWSGRAPILFPIVGALAGDRFAHRGRSYRLPKHGFARRRRFALADRRPDSATFVLDADDETRAAYPFDFRLSVRFTLAGAALTMAATVENRGAGAMPASFGFHPALLWPLPYGGARAAHGIRFAAAEPDPVRRIDSAGLLRPEPLPTPVAGDRLALDDTLFEEDALIFDRLRSRTLRYGAPGAGELEIAFEDLPHLGVWTKPGAPYLCIEPWQGLADPQGFAGELADKPGVVRIAPGDARAFTMRLALTV